MSTFSYAVLKRRKRGREGVAFLRRVAARIIELHCTHTFEAFNHRLGVPNPFGYVPSWSDEADRQALCLISDLKADVEQKEAYAREPR